MTLVSTTYASQFVLEHFDLFVELVHLFLKPSLVFSQFFFGIELFDLLSEHSFQLLNVLLVCLLGVFANCLI